MSSSSEKKEFPTKEDKIITSTLFLFQDNELKLDAARKLKKMVNHRRVRTRQQHEAGFYSIHKQCFIFNQVII